MLTTPFMSRRWLSLAGLCLFLVSTYYTVPPQVQRIATTPRLPFGSAGRNHAAQIADFTTQHLLQLAERPVPVEDFTMMGQRMGIYARLAEVLIDDSTMDDKPLMDLLRKNFPWWQPSPPTYIPWRPRTRPSKKKAPGSTGIVICAGSSNIIYAMHLIRTLRHVLNSTLPIQVTYAGDNDLTFSDRVAVMEMGPDIETLNLLDVLDESIGGLREGGWAVKPFAMLVSRFEKVIMMDADAIFLRSPDDVFETEPGLVETGTLFWHDRNFASGGYEERRGWVKDILGGSEPSAMLNQSLFWNGDSYNEMDSAVVIMDKGRPSVFMSLLFAAWMNTKFVRDTVTYQHVHGKW